VLLDAIEHNWVEVCSGLLSGGVVDVSAQNGKALGMAVRAGNFTLTQCLLRDERVDPSADESRCFETLMTAFPASFTTYHDFGRNTHLKVLEALLKDGRANPAARDNALVRKVSLPSSGRL
jgi:hypothetical protein